MTALQAYRDDGRVAEWIGRAVGGAIRIDAGLSTVLGAIPLAVVLAAADRPLRTYAVIPAAAAFVLLAGIGSRDPSAGALAWAVPPLLRTFEYGFLIALTRLADPDAMPLCFAFLVVLAFHHYDTIYRLRHQRVSPAAWVRAAGGGWDGRLLVAAVLVPLDVLGVGLAVGTAALAVTYVGECVSSWVRFSRGERPAPYEDDEVLE